MVTFYNEISNSHQNWIKKQKIYFVASAPLASDGHVNVSPKGYDSFRVITPNKVCYLELSGSGIETQSHVNENQRLTFMFTAFEGAPRVLRLWSLAKVHLIGTPEFEALLKAHFADSELAGKKGLRSIVVAEVFKVGTSCGFGVPFFDYKEPRNTLIDYWGKRSNEEIRKYWVEHNSTSIDGLPGIQLDGNSSGKRRRHIKLAKDYGSLMAAFSAGVAATLIAVKYFGSR
ncbi:hypothetical protein K493DRAFT_232930 [Basidiobolus meristosporus CBS 931.73]|uniref:Pyridoxamine 5'-phosphate oxidase putative domain-containing protein n=1 Tax=Basidiobolus meristosporus CBS 931.73 TaxID=1314790 RepID=A0A1Y1XVU4_9FUNG|nr:hypothetical protein K493DRAFT_232930 [Basidiobolus meristosporus CBS 931.73]|eukprot:ORX89606.1 hypothetical protein K493DRAFT_232930 [Basidiobolus meristosporus CBS 931.73]